MTPAGLEPAIPGSVGRCLIHWATGPDAFRLCACICMLQLPAGPECWRVQQDSMAKPCQRQEKQSRRSLQWLLLLRQLSPLPSVCHHKIFSICARQMDGRSCQMVAGPSDLNYSMGCPIYAIQLLQQASRAEHRKPQAHSQCARDCQRARTSSTHGSFAATAYVQGGLKAIAAAMQPTWPDGVAPAIRP